jgi:hypothetical protein
MARRLFSGVASDISGRLPLYLDDWAAGFTWPAGLKKTLAATVYITLANALPAITFAAWLTSRTNGELGVVEVILSMAIGGTLFALAGERAACCF